MLKELQLTNEEKKVKIYANGNLPTKSETVSQTTSLEDLNLNWREKDLPEKERTKHVHRLHPYLGKYIPQLVEIFLRKYFKQGDTVLDPFAGSGTTLVQANELGIHSIGCDISEFNVLMMKVKTDRYQIEQLKKEVADILKKTKTVVQEQNKQLDLFAVEQEFHIEPHTESNEYLKAWFSPRTLFELLTYKKFIDTGGYKYKNLLKVILSRSARSARRTTHFDLDFPKKPQTEPYWCYKHSRTCKPVDEAFKFINRYSVDTVKRIETYSNLQTDAKTEIYHADSRDVKFPEINGVITSPPYVGLIDYHEQHAYAYHLLGLTDRREKEIGPASSGSSIKAKADYQAGITTVFKKIEKSVVPGGRIIIVANDKHGLYDDIAQNAGYEMESIIQRHVNRRTGRRNGEFYESIFILRKP